MIMNKKYVRISSFVLSVLLAVLSGTSARAAEAYPAEHSARIGEYHDSSTGEPPVAFDGDIWASGSVDGEQALLPAKAAGLNVETHTPQEIRDFISAHPSDEEEISTWSESPSSKYPYKLGRISDTTRTSALNMLNTVRYIAGLNADVTSDDEYEKLAQAATLADAAFGMLSHYPEKVDDMDQDLYDLGAKGARSCNLGWSYSSSGPDPTLNNTILHGWTGDSDSSNIDVVGHRRWVLSPWMSKTGFGVTIGPYKPADYDESVYTAMYAFDTDDKRFEDVKELLVAWPAQNTPVEYFSEEWYVNYASAWSLSTGKNQDIDKVKVTLVRRSDNKTWSFSKEKADGFFNVDNNNYGQPGCVIFRPDGISRFKAGEVFDVSITGLNPSDVSYTVNFFSANASPQPSEYEPTEITLSPDKLELEVGKTGSISVTKKPADSKAPVSFSSSNSNVASVDTNGVVTARSAGTATITVKCTDDTKTCPVTVYERLNDLSLSSPEVYLSLEQSLTLKADISPSDIDVEVVWESDDKGKFIEITPSADGRSITVSAKEIGKAIVTVTATDRTRTPVITKSATATINVREKIKHLMVVGERLDVRQAFFDQSPYSVNEFTVTPEGCLTLKKGIVTAKKPGVVTITPVSGEAAPVEVEIIPKPVLKFEIPLTHTGDKTNIYKNFKDKWSDHGFSFLGFRSSNPLVADIDPVTGVITAGEKEGSATITAVICEKNIGGAVKTMTVKGSIKVKIPSFKKPVVTIQTGQTMTLSMKNMPVKYYTPDFVSSDDELLTAEPHYNKKGELTGKVFVKAISASDTDDPVTLTATINGKVYDCTIRIVKPCISKDQINIKVGKKAVVSLNKTKIKKSDIVWISNNENVATVDSKGNILGISEGTTVIYTEAGGIRNECLVTVY